MQLQKMLLTFVCATICFCGSARGETMDSKEWIPKLREIFKDDEPYVPEENPDIVRETKFPGEGYIHTFKSDVTGVGRAVTKRGISWFDTQKAMEFHHQANAIIIEEIVSSDAELARGIIKSRFTVQQMGESFASLKGKMDVGPIGSERLAKTLMDLGQRYGDKLKTTGKGVMTTGLSVIKLPLPEKWSKIGAAGTYAIGATLWSIGWVSADVLPSTFDENGYVKLSPDYVEKVFPLYKDVVVRTRHLEGATVDAVWEAKLGYTSIKITPADPQITEDDCRLLAKMIYRTNPLASRKVLPKGYKNKKFWSFKADDIGGMLTVAGVDFDTVRGSMTVQYIGKEDKEDVVEKAFNRPKVPVAMLQTADQFGNKLTFSKKFQDGSSLKLSVEPVGTIDVVLDDDASGTAPVYVRNLTLSKNKLGGRLDKNSSGGFWDHMKYEESSLKLTCEYNQFRQLK